MVKNREIFGKKKEIGETFNNYFVYIGPKLAASIPFQHYIHYNGPLLSTINLMDLELENEFVSLKINKSLRYDDIFANVFKKEPNETFVILKHIFSISLAKEIIPDKRKVARVIPIPEKGNNTLITIHQ